GVLRILGELGAAHRWFPTAVWVDRKRPPLETPEATRRESLLAGLLSASIPGVRVSQIAKCPARHEVAQPHLPGDSALKFDAPEVVLSIPRSSASMPREGLEGVQSDAALALIGGLDPAARASLVWLPGSRGCQVIGHDGQSGREIALN